MLGKSLSGGNIVKILMTALLCAPVLYTPTPSIAASDPLTRFLDGIFKKQPDATATKSRNKNSQTRQVPQKPRPATVIVRDARQKNEANTFIAVIGDSFANSLVDGLRDVFSSNREIKVVNRTSPTANLTQSTPQDWITTTRDYTRESLPTPQPITLGVVFIGADEQRDLLDTDATLAAPGSPRWQALMAERIASLIRTFAERRIPLVWVGLPPMKSEKRTAIATTLNTLYRDEVLKAGGTYVDIWAGFSNDEKGYIATGPDVKGQESRLRTPDGIGLTQVGARKVAHFAELEIRRLLQSRGIATVIATPEQNSLGSHALSDAMDPLKTNAKPVAGPIFPLLNYKSATNGTLIQARPVFQKNTHGIVHQVYQEGRMPEPITGRIDDFAWHGAVSDKINSN